MLPVFQKFIRFIAYFRIYKAGKAQEEYYSKLPSLFSHKRVLLRLVICGRKKSTNRLHVVCHELGSWHLPACEIHPTRSVHASLRKFMVELFGAEVPQHKPHGILSVSCNNNNTAELLTQ